MLVAVAARAAWLAVASGWSPAALPWSRRAYRSPAGLPPPDAAGSRRRRRCAPLTLRRASTWRAYEPRDAVTYEAGRKVVVKNLPRGTDAAWLCDALSDAYGDVNWVDVVGEQAFVVFRDREAAAQACEMSLQVPLDGVSEELSIICDMYEMRIEKLNVKRVFVGNVPYTGVSDSQLRSIFEDEDCRVVDMRRQESRGMAYLEFGTVREAESAVKLGGTRVHGRGLRVDWDTGAPKGGAPVERPVERRSVADAAPRRPVANSAPRASERSADDGENGGVVVAAEYREDGAANRWAAAKEDRSDRRGAPARRPSAPEVRDDDIFDDFDDFDDDARSSAWPSPRTTPPPPRTTRTMTTAAADDDVQSEERGRAPAAVDACDEDPDDSRAFLRSIRSTNAPPKAAKAPPAVAPSKDAAAVVRRNEIDAAAVVRRNEIVDAAAKSAAAAVVRSSGDAREKEQDRAAPPTRKQLPGAPEERGGALERRTFDNNLAIERRAFDQGIALERRAFDNSMALETAARISSAAAWRETEELTAQLASLRAKLPRRATWQPEPFEVRLGASARPRDVLRLKVDGKRDLELAVPDTATPFCVLIVRGALQCFVPRGAYPGAPLMVPLPQRGDGQPASIVVAVPPRARAGDRIFVAYPVDVRQTLDEVTLKPVLGAPLLAPRANVEILPGGTPLERLLEPPQAERPAPLLAPPTTPQVFLAAPRDEAATLDRLRSENHALKLELRATRQLMKKMSDVVEANLDPRSVQALRAQDPARLLDLPQGVSDDDDDD